jgi:uncharacterized membrane protein YdbT with pleckstrin-like domain
LKSSIESTFPAEIVSVGLLLGNHVKTYEVQVEHGNDTNKNKNKNKRNENNVRYVHDTTTPSSLVSQHRIRSSPGQTLVLRLAVPSCSGKVAAIVVAPRRATRVKRVTCIVVVVVVVVVVVMLLVDRLFGER